MKIRVVIKHFRKIFNMKQKFVWKKFLRWNLHKMAFSYLF